MAMYGKLEYWEERYTHSGETASYDWLQTYGSLRHLLSTDSLMASVKPTPPANNTSTAQGSSSSTYGHHPYFPPYKDCRVLILGCGNSKFGEDMRNDGWNGEMVNIDFSSVVIEQMTKKYESSKHDEEDKGRNNSPRNAMKFVCADITQGLPFDDESFDLIICKGTLDAILCSNVSVANVKNVIAECARVLASGHGCLFLVSFANPDNRVVFLEHDNDLSFYWQEVSIHTVHRQSRTGSKTDYVYVCRKQWDTTNISSNHGHSQAAKKSGEENTSLPHVDGDDKHAPKGGQDIHPST